MTGNYGYSINSIRFDQGRPPQRTLHEHAVEQLVEGAISQGLEEDLVRAAVRKTYAQAAMGDLSEKWIEKTVRVELKSLVQTHVHSISYDESADVVSMKSEEFFTRVQPVSGFASWNDAAAATALHFNWLRTEVDRIRNLGYPPIISVRELEEPGTGVVATEAECGVVICCALAGVDVRFRIKPNPFAPPDEMPKKTYRVGGMLKDGIKWRLP